MRISLNKKEIAKDLHDRMGFSLTLSKKLVDDLLNCMIDNIKRDSLYLKNFGVFKILNKKERVGRNPKTKKEYIISARKTIKFKVSKKMELQINEML